MRLIDYLIEATGTLDFDDINSLIHKNCKQYLKLIGHKNPLLRGMDNTSNVGVKDVRKDRTPYGMSVEEAAYLNDWLEKNGHARRDKSVLCNSSDDHVETFGVPYYIFPLDPIDKYTWLRTKDINMAGNAGWQVNTIYAWKLTTNKEYIVNNNILSKLKMPFEDFFTTNKEFNEAHNKGYEIWIDCNKYYFVMASGWSKWDTVKQVVIK